MRWRKRQGTQGADASDAAAARDERLSAHLDGTLSTAERAAIEAELAAEPALRDALDGMRVVQTALMGLGEVRAPRPFTLNADTLTAASVRAARGPTTLELITRIGAVASAAACAIILTTSSGSFAVLERSTSQTAGERAPAPRAPLAAAQPATGAAGTSGVGPSNAPAVAPTSARAANADTTEAKAGAPAPIAPIAPTPQAAASNPPRATATPDVKAAAGGAAPPAGGSPALAPAVSATTSAAGVTSAAASGAAPAAAPAPPAASATSSAAAPSPVAQNAGVATAAPTPPIAAPTSTPALAARAAAPEATRTNALTPPPSAVDTFATAPGGPITQREGPERTAGGMASRGILAAALAALAVVLALTATGQWLARRRR